MKIYIYKINECTRSAEPSPQLGFGKQEQFSYWQEHNYIQYRQYLTVYTTIIILYLCVYATTYTPSPTV